MSKYDNSGSPEEEAYEQMEVDKILSRPENSAVKEFCEKENSDWVGKDKQLMIDVMNKAEHDEDVLRALRYSSKPPIGDEKFRQYDILSDLLFDKSNGKISRDFERISEQESDKNP